MDRKTRSIIAFANRRLKHFNTKKEKAIRELRTSEFEIKKYKAVLDLYDNLNQPIKQ